MIIAHKFLAALQGLPEADMVFSVPENCRTDEDFDRIYSAREATIAGLQLAEKFDFGELHLEVTGEGQYALPEFSGDEMEAWRLGLIPLPADVCWYEFTLGAVRNGLLVATTGESQDRWSAQRYAYRPGKRLDFDGLWISINRHELIAGSDALPLTLHGPQFSKEGMSEGERKYWYGHNVPLMLYLTLMLNSRTTEKHREAAPEKLNKARAKKGRVPLPAHTVVRIVPERYLRERLAEAGRTRLPPRLHWRRSHIRCHDHPTPSSKQLPTSHPRVVEAGKPLWAVLIPRLLISKAADAEVSHEYKIG